MTDLDTTETQKYMLKNIYVSVLQIKSECLHESNKIEN